MMDEAAVTDGLQRILRQVLKQPALAIHRGLTAEDVDGWDSLAHASVILAVERQFRITLPGDRLFELQNVGELIDLILAMTARPPA